VLNKITKLILGIQTKIQTEVYSSS